MIHIMNLHPEPFELIKSKSKTIEVRLNDDKRKLIKFGDIIEFRKRPNFIEKVMCSVVNIKVYPSFYELFNSYAVERFGYTNLSIDSIVNSMYEYYSKEDEKKYGVIAIELNTKK